MPPALGLFSTMIVWPSGFAIDCATTRATVSVGPPAAYGTSMVMFLVGYCCAPALPAAKASAMVTRRNAGMGVLRGTGRRPIIPSHERRGRPSFRHRHPALRRHAPRHDRGAARRRCLRRRPDGEPPAGARRDALRLRGGAPLPLGHAIESRRALVALPARRRGDHWPGA